MTKAKLSAKREKGALLDSVRNYQKPSLLKIPKKNPTLNYRWLRNTPENLSLMEAKGYRVASSDEVRDAGLKAHADGSARKGDLVLGVESMRDHVEHRTREREFKQRQNEQIKHGIRRPMRHGGFEFNETIRNQ